jgi:hypothetical protein
MYGWKIGVWAALYIHYCARQQLTDHINKVLGDSAIDYRRCIKYSTIIFLVGLLLNIISFFVTELNFIPPRKWIANLTAKCGVTSTNDTFHYKSFVYGGYIGAVYGAYLGILFCKYMFGGFNH